MACLFAMHRPSLHDVDKGVVDNLIGLVVGQHAWGGGEARWRAVFSQKWFLSHSGHLTYNVVMDSRGRSSAVKKCRL